jgi:ribonuclease E
VTAAEVIEVAAEEAVEAQPAMAAVETGASVTEDVKPKRARRSRKASPVEEPVVEVAEDATPAVEADVEVEAAAADLATPAAEETKPVRANRESNISSSEPTVKSTRGDAAEGEGDKPKKAGWWQRRGFF